MGAAPPDGTIYVGGQRDWLGRTTNYGTYGIMQNGTYYIRTDPSYNSGVLAAATNAASQAGQASEQEIQRSVVGATPASYANYLNESHNAANTAAMEAQTLAKTGVNSQTVVQNSNGIYASALTGEAMRTGPTYITTPQGVRTIGAAENPYYQIGQNLALFGVASPGTQVVANTATLGKNPAYLAASNMVSNPRS